MSPPQTIDRLPPLPQRPHDGHKGTFGRVLLIAGSPGMAGAAILAARGALRAGAGLVTVALPRSLSAPVTVACPEATQLLLDERQGQLLPATADWPETLKGYQAVGMGPGLGRAPSAERLIAGVLGAVSLPHVLDADALNAVAERPELAVPRDDRIWTPHPGEFERLTGEKPSADDDRRRAALRFVERFRGVLVLKGHRTVVTSHDRCFVNSTGNSGMATGGSGDVLTGVIVALLAQGLGPFDAAARGVQLHGRAGDLAARSVGEYSMIAGDIVDALPAAFLEATEGAD